MLIRVFCILFQIHFVTVFSAKSYLTKFACFEITIYNKVMLKWSAEVTELMKYAKLKKLTRQYMMYCNMKQFVVTDVCDFCI